MRDLWEPKRRIEKQYGDAVKRLLFRFRHICAGYDTPEAFVKALKDWAQSETFSSAAAAISGKLVTHLFTDGAKSWREAARKGSKGRLMAEALRRELSGVVGYTYREQVRENAGYIQQIPLTIAERMTSLAAEGYASGKRESEIMQNLFTLYPTISTTRARLIARTEVSKASAALTLARCREMDVAWYVWRDSEDQRVRKSHRHMSDVLVRVNDPPNPERLCNEKYQYGNYHAGEIFNCRCYPEPLLELHYVKWPHKVYYNGQIQWMTRAQFERL